MRVVVQHFAFWIPFNLTLSPTKCVRWSITIQQIFLHNWKSLRSCSHSVLTLLPAPSAVVARRLDSLLWDPERLFLLFIYALKPLLNILRLRLRRQADRYVLSELSTALLEGLSVVCVPRDVWVIGILSFKGLWTQNLLRDVWELLLSFFLSRFSELLSLYVFLRRRRDALSNLNLLTILVLTLHICLLVSGTGLLLNYFLFVSVFIFILTPRINISHRERRPWLKSAGLLLMRNWTRHHISVLLHPHGNAHSTWRFVNHERLCCLCLLALPDCLGHVFSSTHIEVVLAIICHILATILLVKRSVLVWILPREVVAGLLIFRLSPLILIIEKLLRLGCLLSVPSSYTNYIWLVYRDIRIPTLWSQTFVLVSGRSFEVTWCFVYLWSSIRYFLFIGVIFLLSVYVIQLLNRSCWSSRWIFVYRILNARVFWSLEGESAVLSCALLANSCIPIDAWISHYTASLPGWRMLISRVEFSRFVWDFASFRYFCSFSLESGFKIH